MESGQERQVKIAGLITNVERKVTKQGNNWALIQLADRDGQIEVCFFPATYQLVGHALIADTVVAVTGRSQDRDGSMNIIGQELQELDVSSAENGGRPPVQLRLRSHQINPSTVQKLKGILSAHKGESPVRLQVRAMDKTIVYELGFLVDPTSVASDVKGSFGPDIWIGVA